MQEKVLKLMPHTLRIDGEKIYITGLVKVKNVNESCFVGLLEGRGLQIMGSGIHIVRLEVERGEVELEGVFTMVKYTGVHTKQNVMKRIFG